MRYSGAVQETKIRNMGSIYKIHEASENKGQELF